MKAKLYQQDGTVKGQIDLPENVFGAQVNESLLHQVITQFLANQRQGTAKTKTRAEVSGGGRKPWRQKGTGRARAGSNASPIWVRGGKAHGPEPRDYYSEIPKKMRRLALASALSSRAQDEKVMVVESISCETPKTRTIVDLLKALSVSGKKNLLIIDKEGKNVFLSGRNIRDLEIRPVSEINAYDVLTNENIIFADERLIGKVQEAVAL
ncbi:MAG: 50S ribosomal protein L4 [Fibrobacter sp.]|jgi:large subunit ribosomal protein L4|nr:50S ribosomal protein L4 [Fibrobacter sp.]